MHIDRNEWESFVITDEKRRKTLHNGAVGYIIKAIQMSNGKGKEYEKSSGCRRQ